MYSQSHYLIHYGVPGMKWGRRRNSSYGAALTRRIADRFTHPIRSTRALNKLRSNEVDQHYKDKTASKPVKSLRSRDEIIGLNKDVRRQIDAKKQYRKDKRYIKITDPTKQVVNSMRNDKHQYKDRATKKEIDNQIKYVIRTNKNANKHLRQDAKKKYNRSIYG